MNFTQVRMLVLFSVIANLGLAVDKPKGITSAQLVRELQVVFKSSKLFAPWLAAEKANRDNVSRYQQRRRKDKRLNVKVGHGGTLDPLATGVLIIGVGKGTKQLERFLGCTKSYETVLLFGTATDTYDILGKVLDRAACSHITRQSVEKALQGFRGHIMQQPPMFSALRVNGKRLYEYAREGQEAPIKIQDRPVMVHEIEIVEWFDAGTHDFKPAGEDAVWEEKEVAGKLRNLDEIDGKKEAVITADEELVKRKRIAEEGDDEKLVSYKESESKRRHTASNPARSCRTQSLQDRSRSRSPHVTRIKEKSDKVQEDLSQNFEAEHITKITADLLPIAKVVPSFGTESSTNESPPAVKLRMIVTSGFYVRSLCHDLGRAVGSFGIMAALSRTRQGDFELGKNVMGYEQIDKGEDVWGLEVESMLNYWEKHQVNDDSKEESIVIDEGPNTGI